MGPDFWPNKLNHFFAGGNNWRQDHKPPQEYIGNWQSKFCLPNVPNCNENLVNFLGQHGYSTWGGQADNGSENTVYSYNDDFTWSRGKHTIQFRRNVPDQPLQRLRPPVQVVAWASAIRKPASGRYEFCQRGRQSAFASFLLGQADSGQIDTVRFIGQQFPYFAGYVQDDWRVNPKLVLNLGLRYDINCRPPD